MTDIEKEQIKREIIEELTERKQSPQAYTVVGREITRLAEPYGAPEKFAIKSSVQGIVRASLGLRRMACLQTKDVGRALDVSRKVFGIIQQERGETNDTSANGRCGKNS